MKASTKREFFLSRCALSGPIEEHLQIILREKNTKL